MDDLKPDVAGQCVTLRRVAAWLASQGNSYSSEAVEDAVTALEALSAALKSQEAVSDAVHKALWAADAENARLRAFACKVEAFFLHRIQSENCFNGHMTANQINRARAENKVAEEWIDAARALTGSQSHD